MRRIIHSPLSLLYFFSPHIPSSNPFWGSQLSFSLQYGGISRFWRPLHTSWVWVCLRSVWAGSSQARCLGSGQTGAKLQSPSSCSPIFLRLSVSNPTTRQITWHESQILEVTGMACVFICCVRLCRWYLGFFRNCSLVHYSLHTTMVIQCIGL